MAQVKALDKSIHANIRVNQDVNFAHIKNSHVLPLVLHEIVQASHSYPILFVKDQETGRFKVVALSGLRPGENLCLDGSAQSDSYVPLQVRNYPFFLVQNPENSDQAVLCIDESSEMVGEGAGEALFTNEGEQTEYLQERAKALVDVAQRAQLTDQFVEILASKGLLAQKKLSLRIAEDEEPYDLTGFYVIDEEKLNQLSDEDFLELRQRGVLPAIFAALMSSLQVQSLIRKKQAG